MIYNTTSFNFIGDVMMSKDDHEEPLDMCEHGVPNGQSCPECEYETGNLTHDRPMMYEVSQDRRISCTWWDEKEQKTITVSTDDIEIENWPPKFLEK